MVRICSFFLAALLSLCSMSLLAAKPILSLVADPWCPWDCDSVEEQGFAVDIARAIFEPLGYEVTFIALPWTRAILEVQDGKYNAIIGADKITPEVKTFIFPENPVGIMSNVYVIPINSNFNYKTIAGLKGKKIGIIADYHYGGELGKYIDDHYQDPKIITQVTGTNAAAQNLRMLITGHTDLYVDDIHVVNYVVQKNHMEKQVKIGGYLGDHVGEFIAFSPAISSSKELAKQFDIGIKKLKKNGELSKILEKYHAQTTATP